RNEDACYPPSGSVLSKPPQPTALAIVCDGIGGHEGGNVASNLAIETIQQQLQDLTKAFSEHTDPVTLLADLESAAAAANDKISQRNDNEHRQGRQRMGTTLVMALHIANEMYIAHVGDSRAYWITRHGCYQVTLDDDVASREVRLGYATYRDAVQQGASGSLVQALGMSASNSLHPTSQRFILDEDCIFLLCSDGLSDFDRVEQYWETEILPIITEKDNVLKVTEKLLEIANNQNGHDNVTIAVVHCQVKYSEPNSSLKTVLADLSTIPASTGAQSQFRTALTPEYSQNQKTRVVSTSKPIKGIKVPLQLLVILLLFVASGIAGYLWRQELLTMLKIPQSSPLANPTDAAPLPSAVTGGSQGSSGNSSVNPKEVIQTNSEIEFIRTTTPPTQAIAPNGSVLQIFKRQNIDKDAWVYLRVCSIVRKPSPSNSQSTSVAKKPLLTPGEEVRILSSKLKSFNLPNAKPEIVSLCQPQDASLPTPEELVTEPKPAVPKQ
ncbi:MAG: serine/threonine-protein phosphatase, partial [Microcoleus sp. SIO2G3]|nr:serine/threonine-protein phosphatase [Microcoleus sp. SIO2G3]